MNLLDAAKAVIDEAFYLGNDTQLVHDLKQAVAAAEGIEQPSIDALIAEIDGLGPHFDCPDEQSWQNRIIYLDDLSAILDKYRGQK